jgi:phosphoenolpyruvate carboxylase
VHSLPVERAILLTRAFAFYFELINLAETNHRKRRRIALRLSGEAGRQRGSLAGTLCEMRRVGISADERSGLAQARPHRPGLHRAPH